jgi:hypothetical protein
MLRNCASRRQGASPACVSVHAAAAGLLLASRTCSSRLAACSSMCPAQVPSCGSSTSRFALAQPQPNSANSELMLALAHTNITLLYDVAFVTQIHATTLHQHCCC